MIDLINENGREVDGQMQYPNKFGDDGWYNYTQNPYRVGAMETWYWSMSEEARARCPDDVWMSYLSGENPNYPEEALHADLASVREKVEWVRNDTMTPDTAPVRQHECRQPGDSGHTLSADHGRSRPEARPRRFTACSGISIPWSAGQAFHRTWRPLWIRSAIRNRQ